MSQETNEGNSMKRLILVGLVFGFTACNSTEPVECTSLIYGTNQSGGDSSWTVPCGDTVRTGGLETSAAREARGGN